MQRPLGLSSILRTESLVIVQSVAFLALILPCISFGAAATAFAQQRATTVDVGRTASYGLKKEVYPRSINISTRPQGIAEVSLDTDKSKLRIRGIRPGRTLVTVTGNYRVIIVGDRLTERATPFRVNINVTVLPRILEDDRRAINIPVSRGFTRTYQIHIFMGPAFRNRNEEGVRWRNFRVTPGDNNIARADVNPMRVGITGVNGGRTTITLTGERLFQGTWQRVVRDLRVRVRGATTASSNSNVDEWLEGLRRRYQQLQASVERGARGELSVGQKADVRRNLENLGTVVQNGIRNLAGTANDREEIIAPRRTLLGDIQRDIRRLRENQPTTNTPVIGWSDSVGSRRGQNGRRFTFRCSPNPGGTGSTVWGTDVYTDDSPICKAAVHAGLITYASGGVVTIEIRPAQQSYPGSARNGISTSNWGGWGGSFVFVSSR